MYTGKDSTRMFKLWGKTSGKKIHLCLLIAVGSSSGIILMNKSD